MTDRNERPPGSADKTVRDIRRATRRALTLSEREEISRGLRAQLSLRSIARQLRRAPSTISREVRRIGGRIGYRATL